MAPNTSKLGTPIPCGDSFFEEDAVLTQTHVNFMSTFQKHSFNNTNNSSAMSTPVTFPKTMSTPALQSAKKTFGGSFNDTGNSFFDEDSFIAPNKPANIHEQDMFDSVDEEMNMHLAEQSDFEFDYKISTETKPKTNKSAVEFPGNVKLTSYQESVSQEEMIDDFDDDEDFNAIVSQTENIQKGSFNSSKYAYDIHLYTCSTHTIFL